MTRGDVGCVNVHAGMSGSFYRDARYNSLKETRTEKKIKMRKLQADLKCSVANVCKESFFGIDILANSLMMKMYNLVSRLLVLI